MEVSYARLEEVLEYQPEVYKALMEAPVNKKNPIREAVVGPYAYGLWKPSRSGQYVRRRWVEVWKHQKWKPIPMEKHESPNPNQKLEKFLGDS